MSIPSPSRPPRRLLLAATLTGVVLAGAACEDEATAPEETLVEGQVTLDASSQMAFTYFSLESGQTVDVDDPFTDTEWDIAFRRFSAKLNGGVAGAGGVAGYNLANNATLSGDQVVALTAADGDEAFAAVSADDISSASFVQDGLVEDPGGSWFRFSPQAGTLVANSGAAWRVREADGGFALFRVVELQLNGNIPVSATVEFRHQDAGTNLGAADSVTVDYSQGTNSIDFSTGTVVTPSGCNWDVAFTPQFGIEFNAGCDAGSFPLDPSEDFNGLTTADDAPAYAGFLSAISGAIPNSVSGPEGIFWYNIEGNQRLWPTFNVFLVQKGSEVYKVQVTDYYSATGDSGFPTVRYEQLR